MAHWAHVAKALEGLRPTFSAHVRWGYSIIRVRRTVYRTAGVLFGHFGLRLEVVDHFLGVEDEVMSREQHGEAQPELCR